MRLCSYVIVHDTGFAPNPFGGYFPHVHLAAARHHLLPLCDFDLRGPLHARLWAERLGVILAGLFYIGQWAASYTQRNQISEMERDG
jgi:hypothetical protein